MGVRGSEKTALIKGVTNEYTGDLPMEHNVGKYDKIIRIGVGATLILITLPMANATIGSTLKIIFDIVGVILFVTGVIGFCPIYKVCKISTNKISDKDMQDLMK